MLRPGGQLFITTFAESPLDQAYEKLDDTKWDKYRNWMANSCFYKVENPEDEYRKAIEEQGFVDILIEKQPDSFITFSEKPFWGK